jgi:superfamily II DNA helicase RecQ
LILHGVILFISPLVALMVDQIQHLPKIILGSLLIGGQIGKEVAETLDRLRTGAIKAWNHCKKKVESTMCSFHDCHNNEEDTVVYIAFT